MEWIDGTLWLSATDLKTNALHRRALDPTGNGGLNHPVNRFPSNPSLRDAAPAEHLVREGDSAQLGRPVAGPQCFGQSPTLTEHWRKF
jgi:hypothetical protein